MTDTSFTPVSVNVPDRLCGVTPFETGSWDPFYPYCYAHDIGYESGGTVGQEQATDIAFYSGIWSKALKEPWLIPEALFYTGAVSLVGRFLWKYKSINQ